MADCPGQLEGQKRGGHARDSNLGLGAAILLASGGVSSSPPIVAAHKLETCSIGHALAAPREGAAADAAQRLPEIGHLPPVFNRVEVKKVQTMSAHPRQRGHSRMHAELRHAGTSNAHQLSGIGKAGQKGAASRTA